MSYAAQALQTSCQIGTALSHPTLSNHADQALTWRDGQRRSPSRVDLMQEPPEHDESHCEYIFIIDEDYTQAWVLCIPMSASLRWPWASVA